MKNLLDLAKEYDKNVHVHLLPNIDNNIISNMNFIYDIRWQNGDIEPPYYILTYLMDCYYCLPQRPDLATLFGWQAINNGYNEWLIDDVTKTRLVDTDGITRLISEIYGNYPKYKPLLKDYFLQIPLKSFRYIASYLLKGYVITEKGYSDKYLPGAYRGLIKRIPILKNILLDSYGSALLDISSPLVVDHEIRINADICKSRNITHSFALKLLKLFRDHSVHINSRNGEMERQYTITDEEELTIVIFGLLYASRCNNFHGNVASRLNSLNADKETFEMYTDMFLIEYMIIAVILNIKGLLSDDVLREVHTNFLLML